MNKKNLFIVIVLAVLGITMRLIPHPANFAPMGAIALFAGTYLPKKWSLFVPLGIMLLTDLFLGFYELPTMVIVYGCLALSVAMGAYLKNHKNILNIALGTIGMSLLFFVATNFSVWAFAPWYPKNLHGLALSYFLAVPFFKNSLFSDIFFSLALFGAYELAGALAVKKSLLKQLLNRLN